MAEIESLMSRARAEAWDSLALLGRPVASPYLSDLVNKGWGPVYIPQPRSSAVMSLLSGLPRLRHFALVAAEVGDEETKLIAANLGQLTPLILSRNRVGDEGATAIAANLGQLTSLILTGNSVGTEGARAIAANLSELTSLDLSFNEVGAGGATAIAANLGQLTSLGFDVLAGAMALALD